MKKLIFLGIISVIILSCTKRVKYDNLEQLADKEFAVPTGTIADQLVLSKFPEANFKYYNSVLDACMAVKSGKTDAAAYDEPILKNIAAKNEGLVVLDGMITTDNYGIAVNPSNPDLKKTIDKVLAEIKENGYYEEMMDRWLPKTGAPKPMPEIKLDGLNGTLLFGTSAVTEPFSFVGADGKITGFDIEFATLVAKELGMNLEIVNMDFGAMIPALISDKVDMIGACITINEERAKKVLFSEPYYVGGIAALVKGE